MNKLVITEKEGIVYYGYFMDGKAVELYCETLESPTILGNIYVARVEKIAEGIKGAFLELSPSQKGYYTLSPGKKPVKFTPGHEDRLYGGDLILVQVTKDAVKTKLPVVDTNVSLSGKYFVLSFERKGINVSKKIQAKEERDRLLSIARANSTNDYGVVIRTNAENISEDILVNELGFLIKQAELIMQKASVAPGKTLIHKDAPYYIRLAKELPAKELDEIVTDQKEIYEGMNDYYQSDSDIHAKMAFYQDEYPLYKLYRMDHFYETALQRYVPLKSGGSIVIDPTEAMTVIDVNSGAAIKGRRDTEAIFSKMNREAAVEIVNQLRIRNLSGIILIDFINMKDEKEREQLFTFLQKECLRDRIPIRVIDFTALHLVEMTRNKVRKSLKEQWSECHHR